MEISGPISIDDVACIPWKNGGGTTRQLAVSPEDATADSFLWRISIAQIDVPGEFSAFRGVDRTILLWRGDEVTLHSPAWPDHRLNDPRVPFRFRGEEEVSCDLPGGTTQDLNLMVRRGKVDAVFEIIKAAEYSVPSCDDFVLLCASGSGEFVLSNGEKTINISANHFLRVSNIEQHGAVIVAHGDALLVSIAISHRSGR